MKKEDYEIKELEAKTRLFNLLRWAIIGWAFIIMLGLVCYLAVLSVIYEWF